MSIIVSDTSPIRALAHLNRVDLLHALYGEVLIPPAVAWELEHPRTRFSPILVRTFSFLKVVTPTNAGRVAELRVVLDVGESEAIALAEEVGARAILIDELIGRSIAAASGLTPLGLFGVLLKAKADGIIGHIRPLMDELEAEIDFFISPSLRTEVLRRAGEF